MNPRDDRTTPQEEKSKDGLKRNHDIAERQDSPTLSSPSVATNINVFFIANSINIIPGQVPKIKLTNDFVRHVQKAQMFLDVKQPLESLYYISQALGLLCKMREDLYAKKGGRNWFKTKMQWLQDNCKNAMIALYNFDALDHYINHYQKIDFGAVNHWCLNAKEAANFLFNGEYSYDFIFVMDTILLECRNNDKQPTLKKF